MLVKRLFFGIVIFFFLILVIFYVFSFFIPRTIIVESEKFNLASLQIKKGESKYLKDFASLRDSLILEKANFLEINLQEMKVRVYQEGILKKEASILAVGDPQGWGGSAVGLYQVISKNKTSFSVVSEVYMPFAIHYYGKYYLHGEPYYPGGKKLISSVSGGCIRLSDKDAKAVYNLAEKGMPILVIDRENDQYEYSQMNLTQFPKISAKAYLVADLDSGFVFAEKNSREKFPIASLTKLMTAVVVAEHIDLRKSISVKTDMLQAYGSTQGLEAGKNFRVVELFYPLLIESSNDAAEVLSHFLGRDRTITLMNKKAKAILMKDTEFVDPHGFNPQNISTPQDLFYLARYILNNRPPLLEITKGKKVRAFGEIRFKNLNNKNLFFENPDFLGGKTGYTVASKYTGLFLFRFPLEGGSERKIVIILLGSEGLEKGSENLRNDVQKILDWLKENYFKEG